LISNKIVARFKDNTIKKGTTSNFLPNKPNFNLTLENGEIVDIRTEQLKAIYYVKDYLGNKDRPDAYHDNIPGGGRKIQIEFIDGEVLIGFSQGYSAARPGFFVIPADKENNNERIYIISSAIKKASFI